MGTYELSDIFYKHFFGLREGVSLFEYLEEFTSDEIGEIDLNEDSYNEVFRVGGKYSVPMTDGSYSSLYSFVLENLVHPEDKEIYRDLMDPLTMVQRLKESETPNFRFAQFRIKTQNETYRYIEHAILTGEENQIPEGKVRFYVFDIHNMKGKELGKNVEDSQLSDLQRSRVTGLWNEASFYKHAATLMVKNPGSWRVISIDIDHFKLFDEWYGREKGNNILRKVGRVLMDAEKTYGGLAGYFGQDDFCFVAKIKKSQIQKLYGLISGLITTEGYSIGFLPTFGVAGYEKGLSIGEMYDRASFAGYKAKSIQGCHIYYYEPSIHVQVEEEYQILSDFMAALKNDEIEFYAQPQCNVATGKIVGAESLCRWRKPDGTFVSPAVFIPILEKYGFITDLDKYIWEKVCKALKNWIDEGHVPIPISVNVSQVDLLTIDVPAHFESLIKKYKIPVELFKLEITESSYADNPELVNDVVDRLHKLGFIVLMDDFGAGYSSLNVLSNINFDVIKLDALFLNLKDESYKKSIRIVESIINMTTMLALPVIVEGVENEEQVRFLDSLGIRYVQGFYYYRPLDRLSFEELIGNTDNLDQSGFAVKANEQFRTREFLDENIYSDSMLNNVLGPVAIYVMRGNHVDIIRFNQQFFETVDEADFLGRLTNIENFIPQIDRAPFFRLLHEAADNKFEGSKGIIHFYKTDGTLTTYLMRLYYLGEQEGGKRFYGSATNISGFTKLQNQMKLIAQYSTDSIIFLKLVKEENGLFEMKCTVAVHGLEDKMGLNSKQFEKELNDGRFYERIEPNRMAEIKQVVNAAMAKREGYTFDFDLTLDDGRVFSFIAKGDPVEDPITGCTYIVNFRVK